jgi:hypothetical protein
MQLASHHPNITIPAKRSIPIQYTLSLPSSRPLPLNRPPHHLESPILSLSRLLNRIFWSVFSICFFCFAERPVFEPFLFIPFIICLRIPCVLLFWLVLLFPLTQYRWSNVGLVVFYLLVLHRNGSDLFCGAKAEVKLLLSGVVHGCTYMMDASDYSYNLGCDF